MLFTLLPRSAYTPASPVGHAFLHLDNWDDWGKYRTQFQLSVVDVDGKVHEIGSVKVGHLGLAPGGEIGPNVRAPELPENFDELPSNYFSLGQGESYYEALNLLSRSLRLKVLAGLRDCAFDLDILDKSQDEYVMTQSLLRDVSIINVRNRFHRLAKGDAVLTPFEFNYVFSSQGTEPPILAFKVVPESQPPTNVHVLIGRNGVGKTRNMQGIARSLLVLDQSDADIGIVRPVGEDQDDWSFAGLISVSFSAFDEFELPESIQTKIKAHSIGLKQISLDKENPVISTKSPADLTVDFITSFARCRTGLRSQRWLQAMTTLSNDPQFAETEIDNLLELVDEQWREIASSVFSRLSSGHKIVLLTITRLIELVDEKTLVLIDEPEAHLHPPLLSAFVRSLSNLLVQRNGVAIIATHSPVVLQEVPRSCVSVLRRSGEASVVDRPAIETFGENVGVLTREVFGLEVTTAGFHDLLKRATENSDLTYDALVAHFGGQLGAEARAIARALVTNRDRRQ